MNGAEYTISNHDWHQGACSFLSLARPASASYNENEGGRIVAAAWNREQEFAEKEARFAGGGPNPLNLVFVKFNPCRGEERASHEA